MHGSGSDRESPAGTDRPRMECLENEVIEKGQNI
jgi:hypothetical protein